MSLLVGKLWHQRHEKIGGIWPANMVTCNLALFMGHNG